MPLDKLAGRRIYLIILQQHISSIASRPPDPEEDPLILDKHRQLLSPRD